MTKKLLVTILLLVTFVMQSFAYGPVPTENQKIDIEHLQSVHSHSDEKALNYTDQAGHDIKDCHHCGHCTGSHSISIMGVNSVKVITVNHIEFSPYLAVSPPRFIETTFRPPISYMT